MFTMMKVLIVYENIGEPLVMGECLLKNVKDIKGVTIEP